MSFEDVRNYLASIPNINKGGCGVAALAMYRWLKKNNQLCSNFKFVILYSCWHDADIIENNKHVLQTGHGSAVACSHICITNGMYEVIDSDSEIDASNYKDVQYISEEWFLINMLDNVGSWNTLFDRKWVKSIEKKLNIDIIKTEDKSLYDKGCIFFSKLYNDF